MPEEKQEERMMIKLDISKAFSPRLIVYLASLIPGLFFETSIALSAPETARMIIANMEKIFPLPQYAMLIVFIAAGFILGHVFMQLAWFAELFIWAAYWVWRTGIRLTFGSHTFYKWLGKIQGIPPKRGIFVRLFSWAVFAARTQKRYASARPALVCLGLACKELLKKRYGINVADSLSPSGEEWNVWYSSLGKPIPQIGEGITVMRTTLGCGLAGFLALPFAPNLNIWYFFGICSVFSVTGLYMTWTQFLWRTDPVRLNLIRLQSVLLDLDDVNQAVAVKGNEQKAES